MTHPPVKINLINKKTTKLKLIEDETLTDRFVDPQTP